MGLIFTATAGLSIWIVLWATGMFGGFDGILVAAAMVLLALAVHNVLPYLPGRRD